MSFNIKLLPIALKDLQEAKKWYQEKNELLAEEFKSEVNNEIDYIGKHPQHYQLKYKELRQSLVTRFPFAIFYLVNEDQKQIVVFGVLHTSRNPEIARKKIF